jgi:hypothetical protein
MQSIEQALSSANRTAGAPISASRRYAPDNRACWRRRPPTPGGALLALNGLRVSEATGADIEHLGLERGHRTLFVTRKGGKVVTVPLAPRTARAIDWAVGERTAGPLFLAADGKRLDRHGAARVVRRVTRRGGITKKVGPRTLRHAFITAALDAGVRCETFRRPHRTPTRAPPCATTAPAPASTATPLTSSPPTSPEQPGNPRRWPGRRKRPGQHGQGLVPTVVSRNRHDRARTADLRGRRDFGCCS